MKVASVVKAIIESTFTDKLTVVSYVNLTVNPDGTTDSTFKTPADYTDIPCKLSFSGLENPSDSARDSVPLNMIPKLFFKVEDDISAGDEIRVDRPGIDGTIIASYSGTIGLPSIFVTHKEALFSFSESA